MTANGFGARLRIRIEQTAPVLGDPAANLAVIARAQADAAADGVDLLVTPELSVTGYDVRDRVHALAVSAGPESEMFGQFADGPDVVLGMIEQGPGFVPYNAAVHLRGGRVLHRHRKVYLPTYGMFDEGRWFGRGGRARTYDAGGGWCVGLLVCEDLWHPALAWLLASAGANLLVVQSAAAGRGAMEGGANGGRFASWGAWEHLARAAAVAYGVYVVLANRAGVEGPCVFAGGSMIVGPDGGVIARGAEAAEDRVTADLSIDAVAAARRPYSHLRDDDPHLVAREIAAMLEARR
ncbi:MAG: Nitrilase/cyanide hydratase and apolipoprotein N-acyltransferase [Gemmatimonadetes bacterium]|nr:Nitrilase/cyanide hydratase and apolipoprotein N-acyltransferase [Gemmatimonadota bacterium]